MEYNRYNASISNLNEKNIPKKQGFNTHNAKDIIINRNATNNTSQININETQGTILISSENKENENVLNPSLNQSISVGSGLNISMGADSEGANNSKNLHLYNQNNNKRNESIGAQNIANKQFYHPTNIPSSSTNQIPNDPISLSNFSNIQSTSSNKHIQDRNSFGNYGYNEINHMFSGQQQYQNQPLAYHHTGNNMYEHNYIQQQNYGYNYTQSQENQYHQNQFYEQEKNRLGTRYSQDPVVHSPENKKTNTEFLATVYNEDTKQGVHEGYTENYYLGTPSSQNYHTESLKRSSSQGEYFVTPQTSFFNETKHLCEIYNKDRTKRLNLRLMSKVDKGFFYSEDGWTCYRRNYFQISCSFTVFTNDGLFSGNELPCTFLDMATQTMYQFKDFVVGIFAIDLNCRKPVELIQHTAKREKGMQQIPQMQPISIDEESHISGNINNQSAVTFKRIQFKNSTVNSNKRNATQQYYMIEVGLFANCTDGSQILVATNSSKPIVVRGRSPGYYPENHKRGSNFHFTPHSVVEKSSINQSIIQNIPFISSEKPFIKYIPIKETSSYYNQVEFQPKYSSTPSPYTSNNSANLGPQSSTAYLYGGSRLYNPNDNRNSSPHFVGTNYEVRPVSMMPLSGSVSAMGSLGPPSFNLGTGYESTNPGEINIISNNNSGINDNYGAYNSNPLDNKW
ncbi:hypothetical protein BB558_001682 [Smittium angustum]|uniref:NDT80 domain-containing protein n=1 Tax=Smittium angustum TaxID=133377 RepID=A0A2U1JAQ3_SMIAN|nr:hypothetical protein BB558_001682 [Smittium angustum]